MEIPSWLNINPAQSVVSAASTGASIGAEMARIRQSAALAQAQLDRQDEQAQIQNQLRQKALDQEALRAKETMAMQDEYRKLSLGLAKDKLAQAEKIAQARAAQAAQSQALRLGMEGARLDETERHNKAMETRIDAVTQRRETETAKADAFHKTFNDDMARGIPQRDAVLHAMQVSQITPSPAIIEELLRKEKVSEMTPAQLQDFIQKSKDLERTAIKAGTNSPQYSAWQALTNTLPKASVNKAPVKEVRRRTQDGRIAIFDENTKQFLRYAE